MVRHSDAWTALQGMARRGGPTLKYTLPDKLDSLEDVDPALHAVYVKGDDGKFARTDVSGLKANQVALKQEKSELTDKIRTLESKMEAVKDIDPAEYRELKAKKGEVEAALANAGGEVEARVKQVREAKDGEISALSERSKKLLNRIGEDARASAIREALKEAGANERGMTKLSRLIATDISIEFDGDTPILRVLDDKGKPAFNKEGEPKTARDLVAEAREETPDYFKSAGGGGGGGNADDVPAEDSDSGAWTEKERRAFTKKFGAAAMTKRLMKDREKRMAGSKSPKQPVKK